MLQGLWSADCEPFFMFMNARNRFSDAVIEEMKRQIIGADGNEVFFSGMINEAGIVISVTAASRGNEHTVPVNYAEARKGSVLIHNHPSGNLHPSGADLQFASNCAENAQGFFIVDNQLTEVYVVMEPIKPEVIRKLDEEGAAHYLSAAGPLAKSSTTYEERPVQLELVKKIARSFNQNAVGVFEAGTGVGKSFAYLVPAMLWAAENKERVVVSTGTINLQQQLIEKDIPLAEKIVGKPLKSVLVKGRQNMCACAVLTTRERRETCSTRSRRCSTKLPRGQRRLRREVALIWRLCPPRASGRASIQRRTHVWGCGASSASSAL